MRFGCVSRQLVRGSVTQLLHLAPPSSSGRSSPIPQIVGAEPEDLLRIRIPAGERALASFSGSGSTVVGGRLRENGAPCPEQLDARRASDPEWTVHG